VQDVRARLRALEGEGADLQRLVEACERTVMALQTEWEAIDSAVLLGQQPASALERGQTALRGALTELHAAQADVAAHQAKQARLAGLARDIEAEAAETVKQRLCEAYREAVRTLDQRLREVGEALQPVRTLHALARAQFTRTVLPHVEPLAAPSWTGQSVGLEELLWIWAHDRDVQGLLD
jgi:chromosome segregation ATPase